MGEGRIQEKVQKFGRFLSGMVMPNIGAFIAWGLITALFIPTGWLPNEYLSKLVGPMIIYLLPLLIGYTGGKMVSDSRGGVLGAIATIGVIVGVDIPMFIGAMIMGPLGGYVIKKFDEAIEGKVPAGFEMLINNFSAGIIGALLALLAYTGIGPVVVALNVVLKNGVESIVNAGLLPLVSLFIEPGKILFLNNAMNHGILSPIGIQQAKEVGKSVFFLLEANPGPGLGILLAYWIFSKGMIKQSAPGAIIIHFLGGIHEIYFPYVLMNPLLLLAVIGGGASGVFTFNLLGAGLVASPSPGSIFAVLAMIPKGGYFAVLTGVLVSTVVSFLIASIFVKQASAKQDDSQLEEARENMKELKGTIVKNDIKRIIFACDAGMGSSAMGATTLRNKFKKAGLDIEVVHCAIEAIPSDAQIVVTHEKLAARAKSKAPNSEHILVRDFIDNHVFETISKRLQPINGSVTIEEAIEDKEDSAILRKSNILLGLKSMERDEVIRMAGSLLYKSGYVNEEYIEAMIEREKDLTTYIGKGIAIPHGVGKAKENIKKSGMVVLQFPEGVSFGDETAYMVIGIAGVGNEHLSILSNIATAINEEDDSMVEVLRTTTDSEYIYNLFHSQS
ncbi:PTS mannitol transporter subunit IICBA [Pelosinus sp. UFO1]|uniref:PTS mannitol transporter subunit IICBA n=1 Tax=Pelosinus sp. UFO1 TaxID=484770 RepID=UPI0004D190A1|nr:PTS mannitol transporter subunit IICBA [Pelosinus sp. UFO1]AIF50495.1 PTS system, mannitol-specific IIC subunit [Pelosinus sp. UFO1]